MIGLICCINSITRRDRGQRPDTYLKDRSRIREQVFKIKFIFLSKQRSNYQYQQLPKHNQIAFSKDQSQWFKNQRISLKDPNQKARTLYSNELNDKLRISLKTILQKPKPQLLNLTFQTSFQDSTKMAYSILRMIPKWNEYPACYTRSMGSMRNLPNAKLSSRSILHSKDSKEMPMNSKS